MATRKNPYAKLFKHYVAVFQSDSQNFKYVTSVENSPHVCHWEQDKPALAMSYDYAMDIVYGLAVNGYPAFIATIPDGYKDLGNYA